MSPTPSTCSDGIEILELTDQDLMEQATVRYGDRYDLLSLVGAGAYGSVYRARDSEREEHHDSRGRRGPYGDPPSRGVQAHARSVLVDR